MAVLKRSPKISFLDLREKLEGKDLKVFPITYGRAKALLGLVPMAKRGTGPRAQAKAKEAGEKVPRRQSVKAALHALRERKVASNGATTRTWQPSDGSLTDRFAQLVAQRDELNNRIAEITKIVDGA